MPLSWAHTFASRSMAPQDSPIVKCMPTKVSFSMIHSRKTLHRCQQTPYMGLHSLHKNCHNKIGHIPKDAMKAVPSVALLLLRHIVQGTHLIVVSVEGKTLALSVGGVQKKDALNCTHSFIFSPIQVPLNGIKCGGPARQHEEAHKAILFNHFHDRLNKL